MIVATLRMIVQPKKRNDLIQTIKGMLEPSRVERGCLSYRLYEDVENNDAFVLLEEWATQGDLERHIATDNQRRLLAIMDLLREQPEWRFHTVSQTAGMELMEPILSAGKTD